MVVVNKIQVEDFSRFHHRLRNPVTKRWLHLSAEDETDKKVWAWKGTIAQMRVLADRARKQGKEWPYEVEDEE